MQKKTRFISINEGFECKNCNFKVPTANKTCRNHCTECLFSLHVDDALPGDRESNCKKLMTPIALEIDKKKGYIITHECTSCGKIQKNKTAEDDNFDAITKLMSETNRKNAIREN